METTIKLALAITLFTLATACAQLAHAQDIDHGADLIVDVGIHFEHGVCAGKAYCFNELDSCEVLVDVACTMTLHECLDAVFYAGESEESADVLGCTPDAPITIAVIDQDDLRAMGVK